MARPCLFYMVPTFVGGVEKFGGLQLTVQAVKVHSHSAHTTCLGTAAVIMPMLSAQVREPLSLEDLLLEH